MNYNEMNICIASGQYIFEGNMGLAFGLPTMSATLLYRLYSSSATDHFYTTDQAEALRMIVEMGYDDEGTAAYVYTTQLCGSIPLYRLYSPSAMDHFYTTNKTEQEHAIAELGYVSEGIACYVLPNI